MTPGERNDLVDHRLGSQLGASTVMVAIAAFPARQRVRYGAANLRVVRSVAAMIA